MAVEPALEGRAPFAAYILATLLTAWQCGVGPTALVILLSIAGRYLLLAPHQPFDMTAFVSFLLIASALLLLARASSSARRLSRDALHAALRAQRASGCSLWDWDLTAAPSDLQELLAIEGASEMALGPKAGVTIEPEDLPKVRSSVDQAIRKGESFVVEFCIRTTTGVPRWLGARGEVLRDASGRPARMSGITLDITDRKRADENRAHLASIVESSQDAIITKDLNGIIQTVNAAAERLFGYKESELVGRSVTTLIPIEHHDEEADILAQLRRGQRIDHFETVRVAKDGRRIDISLTISPVRGPTGEIIGASKVARDISEKRRAQRALADQQEWFRVTLGSIGDGVIAADPDGRVSYLNGAAEAMTGWSTAEAMGKPLAEVFNIVSESTRQRAENPASKVIRTGKTRSLANHTLLVARDGSERPIADSAAPILDDGGNILGVVLVFQDVGERRRVEAELKRAADERDRLLGAERAARSEAERANRVKDDFVAMVSHELRTPLNAILGWTHLLMNRASDPETLRRGLDVIARNTRVQAQLISDLLDISRIVSGKLRLEIQSADLASIIQEAIETVQHSADAKQIEIRTRLDSSMPETAGDPARLLQIVWNLLTNAIKFTPQDGHIDVDLKHVDSTAMITVTDNGLGIRPEQMAGLFERFRQGSATSTRRHGGLGLGLSIVKHLVELHGGSVQAESGGEGKGATFTIQLPITSVPVPAGTTEDHGTMRADGITLQNIRILVVEDESETRDLMRRILESHQAEVLTAASAPEALEILSQSAPDILVSDIGLPDIDGYELIRRIRGKAEAVSMIPAIALTAFARPEDRTRALRAGYQTHVAKPVEPSELVATVSSFAELIAAARKA
jgi:PAS domain S-box-containing protein